jgi:hypothetical protein
MDVGLGAGIGVGEEKKRRPAGIRCRTWDMEGSLTRRGVFIADQPV